MANTRPKRIKKEAAAAATRDHDDLVGKRIRVLWPEEKQFFSGTVTAFEKDTASSLLPSICPNFSFSRGQLPQTQERNQGRFKLFSEGEKTCRMSVWQANDADSLECHRDTGQSCPPFVMKCLQPAATGPTRGLSPIEQGMHRIDYDDGDDEMLDLEAQTWRLISPHDDEDLIDDGGLDQLHSAAKALGDVGLRLLLSLPLIETITDKNDEILESGFQGQWQQQQKPERMSRPKF